MISVIFVDDELLIRREIASIFLWLDKEVELVGNFSNTQDAISFLQTHSVDLIIADIRLKNESGMELAKYVHTNKLPAKVILLSAHKSFEYAKEGYKYRVAAYLTKPLDIEELKEEIQKQKKEIKAMQRANASAAQDKSPYILDYFSDILPKTDASFSLPVKHVFLGQIEIEIADSSEYDNNTLYQYISNVLQIHESPFTYILTKLAQNKASVLLLSLTLENAEEFQQQLEQDCSALKNIFQETAGLQTEFKYSYLSFSNQPDYALMNGYTDFFLKNLTENLQMNEFEQVLPLLRMTLDSFKNAEDKRDFANLLLEKLDFSTDIAAVPQDTDTTAYLLEAIREKVNKKDKTIHRSREKMTADITAYIEQNFHHDISLYDIANYTNMNSSYFSRYFKELFDMNFSDYLINFRIDKAKIFLKNKNVSIDSVAAAVGYNHRQAFFKNFKRITGMTPNEYRSTLEQEDLAE